MSKNNFKISEQLQDQIVLLSVIDTEFLHDIREKLVLDWLPSVQAKDVVNICLRYYQKHGESPNGHFPDELENFLKDESLEIWGEHFTYVDGVLSIRKPLRSNVLNRINNLADNYSITPQRKSSYLVDLNNGDRLPSVNLGDIQSQELEWFWDNRFPLGTLNIIAGEPGATKSFWTLDIAARVTTGRPWPCIEDDNPSGSVLLVCCEDSLEHTVKPRLEAAGADTNKIDVISSVVNGQGKRRLFNIEHDLQLLEEHIKSDTRLMVFDPVSAFVGGAGFSMNTKVRSILDPLSHFASCHQITIFLVTHFNKNNRASSLNRILGSVGQTAVARTAWEISNDPQNKYRKLLIPLKANLSKKPTCLAYQIKNGHIEYEPEPIDVDAIESWRPSRPTPRLDEAVEWLEEVLADGPVESAQILKMAAEAGLAEDTLRRAKNKLHVSAYKVGNNENAHWYWTLPITVESADDVVNAVEEPKDCILKITEKTSDNNY